MQDIPVNADTEAYACGCQDAEPVDWDAADEWAKQPIDPNPAVEWNSDIVENAARAYLALRDRLAAAEADIATRDRMMDHMANKAVKERGYYEAAVRDLAAAVAREEKAEAALAAAEEGLKAEAYARYLVEFDTSARQSLRHSLSAAEKRVNRLEDLLVQMSDSAPLESQIWIEAGDEVDAIRARQEKEKANDNRR